MAYYTQEQARKFIDSEKQKDGSADRSMETPRFADRTQKDIASEMNFTGITA